MDADISSRIRDNVAAVTQRIADAARHADRAADDVCLVAVTKYVDADVIRAVVAAGCHDLGESRPQALWSKVADLGGDDCDKDDLGNDVLGDDDLGDDDLGEAEVAGNIRQTQNRIEKCYSGADSAKTAGRKMGHGSRRQGFTHHAA